MKIRNLRTLHGPNVWAACPVVEFELDLENASEAEIRSTLSRFPHDLWDGFPTRPEASLQKGPATVRVGDPSHNPSTDLAHAIAAAARRFQAIAGLPVNFSTARNVGESLRAAVEFVSLPLARDAVDTVVRLVNENAPIEPTADDLRRLKDHEYQQRISPSVGTTYYAAKKRGVPVAKLSPEYNGYLFLGQGSRQRRTRWSEPDAISGVARLASTDKYLTNQLLRSLGLPVPRGKLINKVEDAWPAANEVGLPVAVKPYDCDLQTGVSLDLRTQGRVEAAFLATVEHSSWALVEHFVPGVEHRVVVVGDRVVAVTRIDPPKVVGDGVSSIARLVEIVNKEPRRNGDDAPLSKIKLDDVALAVIAAQGLTVDSVPAKGQVVLARRDPPYFKNGGTLTDLTDVIHPSTITSCVAASRMMQIPVAGLDVVAVDISKPLEEQEGIIVEINANPGLWLHLAPWADSPRPIGEEIANWMFPKDDGRIPVVALVGDAKSVGRDLTVLLEEKGQRVGYVGRTELSAGGRRWPAPAGTPQDRAFVLFRDPTIDVMLIETTAEDLLEHGFANDRCDVAILPSANDGGEYVQALANSLGPTGRFVATNAWSASQLGVSQSRLIPAGDLAPVAASLLACR